jgi:hypothetical protein
MKLVTCAIKGQKKKIVASTSYFILVFMMEVGFVVEGHFAAAKLPLI